MDTANDPKDRAEGPEQQLWNYIDGVLALHEAEAVQQLISTDTAWKARYEEMIALNEILHHTSLEEPSLRFSKNVMEEISALAVTSSVREYINKKVVWGIAAFFLISITGFLIYGIRQARWQAIDGKGVVDIKIKPLDFSVLFSNNLVNVFLAVNVILALVFLERFLSSKNKRRMIS